MPYDEPEGYVTRKVPITLGPTPVPAVLTSAADMLDEFAERDNLIDAPVVAGQLRALLLVLQAGKAWEAEVEETVADRLRNFQIEAADGPQAARDLVRACVVHPDKTITIKPEHGILLVRMCSALGTAGPYLVDLFRKGRNKVKTID